MALELLPLETLQSLVKDYGYWSVSIGIGLENMGIPLPGEALTLLGGFFAGSGELQYRWVLLGAIAGSFMGNNLGYLVGKWGGLPLLQRIAHIFKISDEKLEETKQKFLENAPKAVFFGRFITFFRIFAAPFAGVVGMPWPWFFLCNLAGAIVWGSITVTLPYFLGRIMPLTEVLNFMAKFGLVAFLLIVAWIVVPLWLESRPRNQVEK